MQRYFVPKIIYSALVDGEATTLDELLIFDALTYAEVEEKLPDLLKTRIKTFNSDTIDEIKKMKFVHIIWHAQQDGDAFYKVKIMCYYPKKKSYLYLVPAKDNIEASKRVSDFINDDTCEVTDVQKTKISAFWHNNSEIWQGDFRNRMDRYYEEGLFEAGHTDVTDDDDDDDSQLDFVKDVRVDEKVAEKRKKKPRQNLRKNLLNLAQHGMKVSVKGPNDETFTDLN